MAICISPSEVHTTNSADRLSDEANRGGQAPITYIPSDSFDGNLSFEPPADAFLSQIEEGATCASTPSEQGLPAHYARMCATPLLEVEQERQLFWRMNYCKFLASKSANGDQQLKQDLLQRAERIRNYLIQANTRLVMSIARKFADDRNAFDDLLSQGITSLFQAVDKFDCQRGYRFSTYATCAVRRDLYRMVMGRKRDSQRFATGTSEALDSTTDTHGELPESRYAYWKQLSGTLDRLLSQLDPRERFILEVRFGLNETEGKPSYSHLGQKLGISKERVRQLANRAIDKLRKSDPEHRLEAFLQ